jgi:hypothetical protein
VVRVITCGFCPRGLGGHGHKVEVLPRGFGGFVDRKSKAPRVPDGFGAGFGAVGISGVI